MKIQLLNGYFLEPYDIGYTLKKSMISEKGKKYEKICGYFSGIRPAVERFLILNQQEEISGAETYFLNYVRKIEESNRETLEEIVRILADGNKKNISIQE